MTALAAALEFLCWPYVCTGMRLHGLQPGEMPETVMTWERREVGDFWAWEVLGVLEEAGCNCVWRLT